MSAYRRTPGSSVKGTLYETHLAALLYLRALHTKLPFNIALNVADAAKFDDIVFQYQTSTQPPAWRTCYVQLKHKPNVILNQARLGGHAGHFALQEYLRSYQQIERTMCHHTPGIMDGDFRNCDFVIFTSAENRYGNRGTGDSAVERFLRVGGTVIRFDRRTDPDMYALLGTEGKEFLDRLWIFADQPPRLDEAIGEELTRVCDTRGLDTDSSVLSFKEEITRWFATRTRCLNQSSQIHNSFRVKHLTDTCIGEHLLPIIFSEGLCQDLSGCSMMHVITSPGQIRITSTRVLQGLRNKCLFYRVERMDTAVLPYWLRGDRDLLILVKSTTGDDPTLRDELLTCLREASRKTLIVMAPSSDEFSATLRKSVGENAMEIRCDVRVDDLHQETVDKIMQKEINLQGHSVKLSEILKCAEDLNHLLTDSILEATLSKEEFKIGENLSPHINNYIPRTLRRSVTVKTTLLNTSNRFALTGLTLEALQGMISLAGNEDRFHILDTTAPETQFQALCLQHPDIHWLEYSGNKWHWVASHGGVNVIRDHVDDSETLIYNTESDLDLHYARFVVVVAEPGMGKSTLLTHLAAVTKRQNPNVWVVRVDLGDSALRLNDIKSFLSAATRGLTERVLFEHALLRAGNVHVFLDGYDEVSTKHTDDFLACLMRTKVKRVWTTSRNSRRGKLETRFSTLSHTIAPLSRQNQLDFLRRFWEAKGHSAPPDVGRILTQIDAATRNEKTDEELMGLPDHVIMLAGYLQSNKQDFDPATDLASFFEHLIRSKFRTYQMKQRLPNHVMSTIKKSYRKKHMRAALSVLLNDLELDSLHCSNKLKSSLDAVKQDVAEGRERTGIIDGLDRGQFHFVHVAYVEYLVAYWLAVSQEKNATFIEDYLLNGKYVRVCAMYNSIVAKKSE